MVSDVSAVEKLSTSDYAVIWFDIALVPHKQVLVYRFDFRKSDWQAANGMLFAFDWPQIFSTCLSLNAMYDCFVFLVSSVIRSVAPRVRSRLRRSSLPEYLKRLDAKKHFLWADRFSPGGRGGLEAIQKCAKFYSVACRKYERNYEKSILGSGNMKAFCSCLKRRIKSASSAGVLKNSLNSLVEGRLFPG